MSDSTESTGRRGLWRRGKRLSLDERYFERALANYQRGRPDKYELALADLDEAIELSPRNPEYYVTRGLVLMALNRWHDADEDFELALALDHTQWLVHYGRGMHAFEQREFERAKQFFSRAEQVTQILNDPRPEVFYYRAVARYLLGEEDEAIRDMEFAVELLGDDDRRARMAKRWLSIFRKT